MMRSLFSGVAGLKTHQTKMDVIGNNIANVNTVGYKSQTVVFSDVLYQTTQSASGSNKETGKGGTNAKQIGLGSSVSSISTKITETGGTQSTNNPFDLMINGDSFFIVNNAGTNYFTKAGNFTVDDAGNLCTSQGYIVQGWQADDEGNVLKTNVSGISIYDADTKYAPPEQTTAATVSGNINKEDESFEAGSIAFNVNFYDNLGYKYQATITVSQTSDYEYEMAVTQLSCNGSIIGTTDVATAYKEGLTTNPNDTATSFGTLPGLGATTLTFSAATGECTTANLNLLTSAMGIEAIPQDIELDFTKVTCLGTDTSIDTDYGDINGNNKGRAVGNLTGVSISTDGKIIGSYDNGQQRVISQIAVATFTNPSGLEKAGDNLFQQTMNSGEFDGIGVDITADGGYLSTGVLEMSNVDLAAEFTEMITTQRGFQANSRIITVSDTLLEELINLKR